VGFVPIQIVNLSLEEVELHKHMYVGVASPTRCCDVKDTDDYGICIIQRGENKGDGCKQKFEEYLQEKLAHLKRKERQILELVLRKYCHFFMKSEVPIRLYKSSAACY
jgi:DNA-directed RNA polymerase specialized sigma subunit